MEWTGTDGCFATANSISANNRSLLSSCCAAAPTISSRRQSFPTATSARTAFFVNVDAGIETPADLIGKRVGVWSFQTTLSVLARGDLKSEYGVPWEQIDWHVSER